MRVNSVVVVEPQTGKLSTTLFASALRALRGQCTITGIGYKMHEFALRSQRRTATP